MPEDVLEAEIAEDADDLEGEPALELRYAITSYGADMPVDGLVSRIRKGDIVIPAFQRPFTWTLNRASRFIESLLLGLPVPSIFLAKERETGRQLVIDGQQRLLTLQRFYDGVWPDPKDEQRRDEHKDANVRAASRKVFALFGVQPEFEGRTYESLADQDRRRLDDAVIHAIVVRQDEPSDDDSSVYEIFERLNTGGVKLSGQEIRTAVYRGEFIDLLKDLDGLPSWRSVVGSSQKGLKNEELILRFLAFYYDGDAYTRPMKNFLNSFAGTNRHLAKHSETQIRTLFANTTETINRCLGSDAFRRKRSLNAAIADAVMVGIARRLERGPIVDCARVAAAHRELLANKEFEAATELSTAGIENVASRLLLARRAFESV